MINDTFAIDFTGARVLVTGGSRGIAAEIARSFARNGASVAINYCSGADESAGFPDAAQQLVAEMEEVGPRSCAIEADLIEPGSAGAIVSEAEHFLGGIDILVSSASMQIHADFMEISEADIERQLQINLVSVIQLIQAVLPAMRERRSGRIITIGSVQETMPSAEMPVYAMTKSAQENLVRNLAGENAAHGITVNNVAPGLIETDRNAFRRQDRDKWQSFMETANPIGRAGLPSDVAPAVLYLASNFASFITGATIPVTGGAPTPASRHLSQS